MKIIDYNASSAPRWVFAFVLAATFPWLLVVPFINLIFVIVSISLLSLGWFISIIYSIIAIHRSYDIVWLDRLRKIDEKELAWLRANNISCTIRKYGVRSYIDFNQKKRDQEEGLVMFTLAFGPISEGKSVGLKSLNREW